MPQLAHTLTPFARMMVSIFASYTVFFFIFVIPSSRILGPLSDAGNVLPLTGSNGIVSASWIASLNTSTSASCY